MTPAPTKAALVAARETEDAEHRIRFDDMCRRMEWSPLENVHQALVMASRLNPADGSYSKMTAIYANEIAAAVTELSRLRGEVERLTAAKTHDCEAIDYEYDRLHAENVSLRSRLEAAEKALAEVGRLSLVIHSAVRSADPNNREEVAAALTPCNAAFNARRAALSQAKGEAL
jgi:hypothetical protein